MNRNAARLLIAAPGVAFMLTMIAWETARGGSPVAATTDEAQQSKAGGQNKGQAQSSKAAPSSPEAVTAVMWQKITSTCPVQGAAKPALFYEETITAMDGGKPVRKDVVLFEFRDAWTMYRATTLSEADRLNGVQSAGTILLGYSAYREFNLIRGYGHGWGKFQPGNDRSQIDAIADHYNWSWPLQKSNGKWSISGPWGSVLDPDSIAASKRSCAALTSADPFAAK